MSTFRVAEMTIYKCFTKIQQLPFEDKQRKKLIQTVLLLMLKESACKYLANITKNTK